MKALLSGRCRVLCWAGALVILLAGCGKRDDAAISATTPKAAASTLEQAFQAAAAPVQENVRLKAS